MCRSRLRELTTKLVTLDPVQLGTKAMEVYWRKAYHEPVALARQLRERNRRLLQVPVRSALAIFTISWGMMSKKA